MLTYKKTELFLKDNKHQFQAIEKVGNTVSVYEQVHIGINI